MRGWCKTQHPNVMCRKKTTLRHVANYPIKLPSYHNAQKMVKKFFQGIGVFTCELPVAIEILHIWCSSSRRGFHTPPILLHKTRAIPKASADAATTEALTLVLPFSTITVVMLVPKLLMGMLIMDLRVIAMDVRSLEAIMWFRRVWTAIKLFFTPSWRTSKRTHKSTKNHTVSLKSIQSIGKKIWMNELPLSWYRPIFLHKNLCNNKLPYPYFSTKTRAITSYQNAQKMVKDLFEGIEIFTCELPIAVELPHIRCSSSSRGAHTRPIRLHITKAWSYTRRSTSRGTHTCPALLHNKSGHARSRAVDEHTDDGAESNSHGCEESRGHYVVPQGLNCHHIVLESILNSKRKQT